MATKKKAAKATASKSARTASKPASAKSPAKKSAATPARAAASKTKGTTLQSASPSFTVADVEKSLAWYRDVLGFAVGERWESKGKLMGAEMNAGDVTFMIGQDDWKKGRDRIKGEGVRIFCMTGQDIDRLAERIKANGGKLTQEPTDQSWGMRDLSIDDPDGFKITIGANLKKKR